MRAVHLATVAAMLLPAALPAAAPAAATCSFDAATATATVAVDEALEYGERTVLRRSASGAIQVDGAACGAATVTSTDAIRVVQADPARPRSENVAIDLAGGPLGPGKTSEGTVAGSEIEVTLDTAGGWDGLHVLGSEGTARDLIRVGAAGATLNGDTDVDVVLGTVDEIELHGRAGDDVLSLGGGGATGGPSPLTSVILGGPGSDALTGGDEWDRLYGDRVERYTPVDGGGDDVLRGGGDFDFLEGEAGDDRVYGEGGGDSLAFDPGDDLLDGGPGWDSFGAPYRPDATPGPDGADVVRGGTEIDRINLSQRTAPQVVRLDDLPNDGEDTSATPDGVAEEGDNYRADIEEVTTGSGDDRLWASYARADAAAGAHHLRGGAGDDSLKGGGAGDHLRGGAGLDALDGGTGDDQLDGEDGADALTGGDGADHVDGGIGADRMSGGPGDDEFPQEPEADGPDVVGGGGGRDRVRYSSRRTPVHVTLDSFAGDGEDTTEAYGGEEGDNVRGDVEDVHGGLGADYLRGSRTVAVANELVGGDGDDELRGAAGQDDLLGGDGDDEFDGGAGDDRMWGGAGEDFFWAYDRAYDVIYGGPGFDEASADPFDALHDVP